MMHCLDRFLKRYRPAAMLSDERNCLLARQWGERLFVARPGPVDAILHTNGAEPVVLDLVRKVAEPELLAHRPPGLALIGQEIERDPAVPCAITTIGLARDGAQMIASPAVRVGSRSPMNGLERSQSPVDGNARDKGSRLIGADESGQRCLHSDARGRSRGKIGAEPYRFAAWLADIAGQGH